MHTSHGSHARPQEQVDFCLAWCYERCNKADQADTLAELQVIARSFGSSLVLHKKSTGFLNWLEGSREKVCLLADWREAKPIIDGLTRLTAARQQHIQLRMCILAQSDKMYRRASEWASLVRQGGGREIAVLDGYSREGVEEFLAQGFEPNEAVHAQEEPSSSCLTSHTRDVGANSSQDAEAPPRSETAGSADSASSTLSLVNLMRAVQDPQEAARLEVMIQRAMWQQPYED